MQKGLHRGLALPDGARRKRLASGRGGCLSRKIARYAAAPCCPGKTWVCLEVFAEQGLLVLEQRPRMLRIRLTSEGKKVDLEQSQILRHLKMQKAGN